jgi:ABC-type transport system involved in cytochrome bd biosynthesis fused ATPase/permease subunit
MLNKRLIQYMRDSRIYVILTVALQWCSLMSSVAVVFSVAMLLEQFLRRSETTNSMFVTAIVLAGSALVRFLCDKMSAMTSYKAAAEVKKKLRENLYKKLCRLGASYHVRISTAEALQVGVEGVEQLEFYFSKYLPQLFYSILAPVTLFIILSFINLKSALVLLICVPLIPVSIIAVQKIAGKLFKKYWGSYTNLGDRFLENLQGLITLKIYRSEGNKAKEMQDEAENFRKITMKVLTMQLNSVTLMDLIAFGGAAVGTVISIREYMQGNLSFGGTIAIILLSAEFFIPLRQLGSFFHVAMNGMAASARMFRILDLKEHEENLLFINKENMELSLSKMEFAYQEDRKILADINIHVCKGSFIAIVGESGSGKSTLAALLTGKQKGYGGSIKIGDLELSEISEKSILNNITMISHNSYLFMGTVEENLRMGKQDATPEEMKMVLKQVKLYDFFETEDGLSTMITEEGGNLSGGQRQRLSLARGLLHDTPIYIFDEAISNIDAESEGHIMETIRKLAGIKTVILISHRLANVTECDKIFVLQEGRVSEEGAHDTLMKSGKIYRSLFENQRKLEEFVKEREEEICVAAE